MIPNILQQQTIFFIEITLCFFAGSKGDLIWLLIHTHTHTHTKHFVEFVVEKVTKRTSFFYEFFSIKNFLDHSSNPWIFFQPKVPKKSNPVMIGDKPGADPHHPPTAKLSAPPRRMRTRGPPHAGRGSCIIGSSNECGGEWGLAITSRWWQGRGGKERLNGI